MVTNRGYQWGTFHNHNDIVEFSCLKFIFVEISILYFHPLMENETRFESSLIWQHK